MSTNNSVTSVTNVGIINSPDVSPFVSLTMYDQDPTDIYNTALQLAQQLFPGWTAPEGATETVLMQVFATVAAEMVYAINRLPDTILQNQIIFAGIQPSPGVQSSASATFNLGDILGHTIPAGTVLQLVLSQNTSYTYTTNNDLVIPTGASSGVVPITCTVYSAAPNGVPAGTPLNIVGTITTYAESVVLTSPIVGGVDPETTTQWMQRATQAFQSFNATLCTPTQMQQALLGQYMPSIFRCTVVNNWNSATNASALGYVTALVYGQGGASCTPSIMTQAQTYLASRAAANLSTSVIAAEVTTIDVVVTVQRLPGYVDSDVASSVQSALQGWLSTDSWPWDATVRYTKAIDIVENVAGVDFVTYLTLNGAQGDVAMPGLANLAEYGTITVNVNDPSTVMPQTTVVNVSATVYQSGGVDATVQSAVQAAVTTFLGTAISSGTIRLTSLVATIAKVANVTDVQNVTINGEALDLVVTPSETTAGTITITMAN